MLRKLLLACLLANVVLGFVDDGQLSFRNKTYIIGSKKFSWYKAFTYCAEKGMHLLNLESINSNKWLTNYLDVKIHLGDMRDDLVPPYWVSAFCEQKSGRIRWVTPEVQPSGQEPIACTALGKDEQSCILIYNNHAEHTMDKFDVSPCYNLSSFICEN
ncbi:uncharacterized protein LOC135940221 [Cloeon dipterum]|uniref:uncharacterized protein LOC135940221 n=1 Tax=Cloeon dipterum TaxID=197152 RepID=UPI0032204D86